jgi:transcriptional regulator with XRE-family HTH domain
MPPAEPPSDFARELGGRIRAARLAKKPRPWSLERLGHHARVNWSYIAEIERAEVNPSVLRLARIATALEIDLGELMRELPAPPPGKDPYLD